MNCSPAHILKDISTQQRIWTTRPTVHSPSRWFQILSSSLLARSYITWSRTSHPTVPWLVSWSTETTKQKLMAAVLRYYAFEVTRGTEAPGKQRARVSCHALRRQSRNSEHSHCIQIYTRLPMDPNNASALYVPEVKKPKSNALQSHGAFYWPVWNPSSLFGSPG